MFGLTLEEIRDKKLGAVINTKTKNEALLLVKTLGVDKSRFYDETDFIDVWDAFKENTCYRVVDGKVDMSDCVKYYQSIHEKIYKFSDLFATGGVVSINDLPTSEWYNPMRLVFKNGSSIDALPQKDDAVRGENHFCTGFEAPYLDLSVFLNDGISAKNGGKNSMKFTFYVTEGTRVDKSCNGTIPTITTTVEANSYSRTAPIGTATCDKADYDMRQGVLEALANMYCDGDFDKVYNKAVKRNELADKKKRICKYCGKVFDTVEEREAEEAWHVERKKARRERYLLRKRAKEIAFEKQAQKMAKEMMGEK